MDSGPFLIESCIVDGLEPFAQIIDVTVVIDDIVRCFVPGATLQLMSKTCDTEMTFNVAYRDPVGDNQERFLFERLVIEVVNEHVICTVLNCCTGARSIPFFGDIL